MTGSRRASMPCWLSKTASFMGRESAIRTWMPAATYSLRRWRCSSSSVAASSSRRHDTPPEAACLTSFSSKRIDGVGRARELHVLVLDLRQHAPVFGGGLRGLAHDAQEIQRATAALAFGVERLQIVDQTRSGAHIVGQCLLQHEALAAQVSGQRQARLHGGEELGLLLDHLRKPLFDEAVENLVDLLARDVRARRQFQRLEPRMTEQHEIRTRLISVEPKLLQAPPEPLKVDFRQFFAHNL